MTFDGAGLQRFTYHDLSERWGISHNTLRAWKHRGILPEPDEVLARTPVWYEKTIKQLEDADGRLHRQD